MKVPFMTGGKYKGQHYTSIIEIDESDPRFEQALKEYLKWTGETRAEFEAQRKNRSRTKKKKIMKHPILVKT
jgi:hypothetical protein